MTILSAPKPSYFPAYVRQPTDQSGGTLRGGTYATYTSIPGATLEELRWPEIRGFKRYPARAAAEVLDCSQNTNNDVKVFLRPLPDKTTFKGRIRFHNLRPVELGALLWALEWGGAPGLRHSLGMAKPYGLGQVTIAVDDGTWRIRATGNGNSVESKKGYQYLFVSEMEKAYKNAGHQDCSWRDSEQISQLKAMANAEQSQGMKLSYMTLDPIRRINEFQTAKDRCQVLKPHPGPGAPSSSSDHALFPRTVPRPDPATGSSTPERPPVNNSRAERAQRNSRPNRHQVPQPRGHAASGVLLPKGTRVRDKENNSAVVLCDVLRGETMAFVCWDDGDTEETNISLLNW